MARLLIGTSAGLFELDGGAPQLDGWLGERDITTLADRGEDVWAVIDGSALFRRDRAGAWSELARSDDRTMTCVVATSGGPFVGTEGAHLLVVRDGELVPNEPFDQVEGRGTWFTPWGGPPAVRSLATDLEGRIHTNVHVGGIPRSVDEGRTWTPTIDIDSDIHQVVSHPTEPDVALAAGAVGLALSENGGASWRIERNGLDSTYARAVAVAGDTVLMSASSGPSGGRAALYRTVIGPDIRFEKCVDGLPEWFDGNIDTGWLVGRGSDVAFATGDGSVFGSDDAGAHWQRLAADLPKVRWLSFA
ncbi:MAG: hypothetical protein L0206_02800 [Actinobacteria bacterium]|nr:hypothetical protein [Actinomycetota bacterium]